MKMELHQLIKYLGNDCSTLEKDEVETWLKTSGENQTLFLNLKKQWEAAEAVPENLQLDFENAWKNIQSKTGLSDSISTQVQMKWTVKEWLRIAAIFIGLVGIGAAVYTLVNSNHFIKIETTQTISRKEVRLADGTMIYLNHNSSITFPDKFKTNTREVNLEGEAFFNVTRDTRHPFIVHANGTTIKVLGTSFNIKIKGLEQVLVSVLSGKVAFQAENNQSQMVQLEKGDQGLYSHKTQQLNKQQFTDKNFLAWETGVLTFNNTKLIEAVHTLSDYYSKTIEIDPSLQNRSITVTFNNKSIEEVLKILEITLDITTEASSQKIVLKPTKTSKL